MSEEREQENIGHQNKGIDSDVEEEKEQRFSGLGGVFRYMPDSSSLLNGAFRKLLASATEDEYESIQVNVSRCVLFQLERLAEKGLSTGISGLAELDRITEWLRARSIPLEVVGEQRGSDIARALDLGALKEMIRRDAEYSGSVFVTCDQIQLSLAKAEGLEVVLAEIGDDGLEVTMLEDFFDADTMSIHLKAGIVPKAKRGLPGEWALTEIGETPLAPHLLRVVCDSIIERARRDEHSFVESEEEGSAIIQLGSYRIVITSPPFSSALELTAVRPIRKMTLEDYELDERLTERLAQGAEGILVGGSPGAGKSTLATALAEYYAGHARIVKTLECPRDLQVGPHITQLSAGDDPGKVADVLLLTRPDYVIYDEIRKNRDFEVFTDMRLAGIGLVGIVHATKPIDAIQRLIGRVDLGVIPSIIDTVLFIDKGEITDVYMLAMTVKTPSGMMHSDLARPVIEVRDFFSDRLLYELFTFGDQIMVVPIASSVKKGARRKGKAGKRDAKSKPRSKGDLASRIAAIMPRKIAFELKARGKNRFDIIVAPWDRKAAKRKARFIENKLNISVSVVADERIGRVSEEMYVYAEVLDEFLVLRFDMDVSSKLVQLASNGTPVCTLRVGSKGIVKLEKNSALALDISSQLETGKTLTAFVL